MRRKGTDEEERLLEEMQTDKPAAEKCVEELIDASGEEIDTTIKVRMPRSQRKYVFPESWRKRLMGVSGQAYELAFCLRHHDWKGNSESFTLTNVKAVEFGVPARTKPDLLRVLESRGVVWVDWQNRKSPWVKRVLDPSVPSTSPKPRPKPRRKSVT
jgi:hypothetical protein